MRRTLAPTHSRASPPRCPPRLCRTHRARGRTQRPAQGVPTRGPTHSRRCAGRSVRVAAPNVLHNLCGRPRPRRVSNRPRPLRFWRGDIADLPVLPDTDGWWRHRRPLTGGEVQSADGPAGRPRRGVADARVVQPQRSGLAVPVVRHRRRATRSVSPRCHPFGNAPRCSEFGRRSDHSFRAVPRRCASFSPDVAGPCGSSPAGTAGRRVPQLAGRVGHDGARRPRRRGAFDCLPRVAVGGQRELPVHGGQAV